MIKYFKRFKKYKYLCKIFKEGELKKALLLVLLLAVSAFAGTTAGGMEGLWNQAVNIFSDKYLGYLIAGYQLYEAYRLRVAGETGRAVERIIYAGAFGGFATMAQTTAGAILV